MAFPLDTLIDLFRDVHTAGGGSGAIRTLITGGSVTIDPTTLLGVTPTLANISAATANTEYSYILPTNTKRFIFKARGLSKVQLTYTSGSSGTTYATLSPGSVYEESGIYSAAATTLYFQTSTASETLEIISWV